MIFIIFISLLFYNQCAGVIYHLNDSDYYRMPRLSSLDIYDECLYYPGSLYCLARFDLVSDTRNDLMTLIQEYSAYRKKHYNHSYVDRGLCVTKSCREYIKNQDLNDTENLKKILENCVNETIWKEYGIQAKLANIYSCDKYNEKSEIDYTDWTVAAIIVSLLVVNIFGCIYDKYFYNTEQDIKQETTKRILLSFSIPRNWEALKSAEPTDPRLKKLKGLHSIKVIGMLFVILGHTLFLNSTSFSDNPRDFEKAFETTHYQLIATGLMSVEVFFLLSGFLLVYNLQVKTEKIQVKWTLFPKIMLLRWWRLSAPYAVVLGFTSTWLRHLGSGPLWKYAVVNSVVADCRKTWWLHLLYANNYVGYSICGVHTWHVAADTQLFTIGLAVYLLTRNRGKKIVLTSLLLLGMVAPAIHVWLQDFDPIALLEPEFLRTLVGDHFKYLHIPAHNNIPSFIIGMSIGYFLYNTEVFNKYCHLLPDKTSAYIVWLSPVVMGRYFLTGRMFYEEFGKTSLAVKLVYAATHRFLLACMLSLVVILLVTRLSERARRFFEWHGWVVPSKLSYSVYLLHMYLLYALLGLNHQLTHVSVFNVVIILFAVVSISFVMAIPLYLFVEAPMGRLLNVLMNGNFEKREDKKVT